MLAHVREGGLAVPEPVLDRLRGRCAMHAHAADLLRGAVAARLHGAFDAGGVPCLLLKGAALAQLAYPRAAQRPMRDLDSLPIRGTDRTRAGGGSRSSGIRAGRRGDSARTSARAADAPGRARRHRHRRTAPPVAAADPPDRAASDTNVSCRARNRVAGARRRSAPSHRKRCCGMSTRTRSRSTVTEPGDAPDFGCRSRLTPSNTGSRTSTGIASRRSTRVCGARWPGPGRPDTMVERRAATASVCAPNVAGRRRPSDRAPRLAPGVPQRRVMADRLVVPDPLRRRRTGRVALVSDRRPSASARACGPRTGSQDVSAPPGERR